jgi:uncharacterized membrane protein
MDPNRFSPHGLRDGMMQVAGHQDGGGHPLSWAILAVLLVVLLLVVVSLVLDVYHRSSGRNVAVGTAPPSEALTVLDSRYATGELTRKDSRQAREDIAGPGGTPAPAPAS